MKKFLLYFLLLLFIAGLATLTYGFWNAKNIRLWAAAAGEIKARHDISAREKDISNRFEASGGKKMEDLKSGLSGFEADLDVIRAGAQAAGQETESLGAPRAAKPTQKGMAEFYAGSGRQIQNFSNIVKFLNQLFEVALIFDSIEQDTKLQEIQALIAEAKTKSGAISTDILPDEVKNSGAELKSATDEFLEAIDETAAGKVEGNDRLNASYAEFSQKQNDFFADAKKYTDSFREMEAGEKKIDSDLATLGMVRFSIK